MSLLKGQYFLIKRCCVSLLFAILLSHTAMAQQLSLSGNVSPFIFDLSTTAASQGFAGKENLFSYDMQGGIGLRYGLALRYHGAQGRMVYGLHFSRFEQEGELNISYLRRRGDFVPLVYQVGYTQLGFGFDISRSYNNWSVYSGLTLYTMENLSTANVNSRVLYTDQYHLVASTENGSTATVYRRYFGSESVKYHRAVIHLMISRAITQRLKIGMMIDFRYAYRQLDRFAYYSTSVDGFEIIPFSPTKESLVGTLTINQALWSTGIQLSYELPILNREKRKAKSVVPIED